MKALSQAWWHMLINPAFGRWRQEDHEYQVLKAGLTCM
jgi:hypothetical protein